MNTSHYGNALSCPRQYQHTQKALQPHAAPNPSPHARMHHIVPITAPIWCISHNGGLGCLFDSRLPSCMCVHERWCACECWREHVCMRARIYIWGVLLLLWDFEPAVVTLVTGPQPAVVAGGWPLVPGWSWSCTVGHPEGPRMPNSVCPSAEKEQQDCPRFSVDHFLKIACFLMCVHSCACMYMCVCVVVYACSLDAAGV